MSLVYIFCFFSFFFFFFLFLFFPPPPLSYKLQLGYPYMCNIILYTTGGTFKLLNKQGKSHLGACQLLRDKQEIIIDTWVEGGRGDVCVFTKHQADTKKD